MRIWLLALTDFGDAAVLLPIAVAILVWLLFTARRLAVWWVAAFGLCIGLTSILKIFFHGCPPTPELRSPSGHTAFSLLVYGAIALAAAGDGWRRVAAIGAGSGLVLAIAASRLLLDIHSLVEIGLGALIGAASLAVFGGKYPRSAAAKVWPLLATVVVIITLLHGQELHAEELLHRLTGYFHIRCR